MHIHKLYAKYNAALCKTIISIYYLLRKTSKKRHLSKPQQNAFKSITLLFLTAIDDLNVKDSVDAHFIAIL